MATTANTPLPPSLTHHELPDDGHHKFYDQRQRQLHNLPIPAASLHPLSKVAKTRLAPIEPTRLSSIMPTLHSIARPNTRNDIDLSKIVLLFTGRHTYQLYERHVAVLIKLAKVYQSGVTCNDIHILATVLHLAFEKVTEGGVDLIPPIIVLVERLLCFEVTLKDMQKSNGLRENITLLHNSLSKLLILKNDTLSPIVAEAVFTYSGGIKIDTEAANTHRIVFSLKRDAVVSTIGAGKTVKAKEKERAEQTQLMLAATSKSHLVKDIAELLRSELTMIGRMSLLKCLRQLSWSDECVRMAVDVGVFQALCHLTKESQPPVTFYVIEVLWNALSGSCGREVAQILGTMECLEVLKELFDDLALNGHCQADKQLRNDILTVFIFIVNSYSECVSIFFDSGLLDSISMFLIHPELNKTEMVSGRAGLTSGNDDFDFKRLLFTLSHKMVAHAEILSAFLEDGLIKLMMLYLVPNSKNPVISLWSEPQLRSLQIRALGLLSNLIPKISREFRLIDGYTGLVKFLEYIIQQECSSSSSHIDTSRERHRVLRALLGVVLNLTEVGPTAKKTLVSLNIFVYLLELLGESVQEINIRCMSLMICSSLCRGYRANKTVFGDYNGVKTVIPFLKYRSADPVEQESVILAVVECIWGSVSGNYINEDMLFQNEGVVFLLDILEVATTKTRRHVLGCLLDLLENPKCIYHVLQWRMHRNVHKGIEHLLIEIWNSEEAELGVSQGPFGFIDPTNNTPLHGTKQKTIDLASKGTKLEGGGAIHEIQENMRAKVYSMFSKLGFDRFHETFSINERVKLALISKYLDFKIGEVWIEIADELGFEGIRPVSPDQDCIDTVRSVLQTKYDSVYQRQTEIQRQSDEMKHKQELAFYDELKTREAFHVRREMTPGAMNGRYRKVKKQQQQQQQQ
ncbi:hypothetical protein BASA50_002951 [Batrachochytrium salamandrivorans]|uniref:Cilia- and flagella-associated protein 69 ARM repeats domain-containing protein n=1 Tax=Batrachochytrium salamandrivorans TaxID=1357716 RepID=A0ABQ8FMX4_9FUNG|nr:hypothetical protein BASA61_006265 [Batrachochytrium salamandrivorans]KAH6599609.1 hypothetical protein BASA50_002951 [Batrachochytrium salamandrivorans]KAH9268015.1 hypothetical protein BASA84_000483 [Batrachochytrium salamandrivorans]